MSETTQPALHVLDDPSAAVAELLAEEARRGGNIVLTGGSSVERCYELAAALQPDWSEAAVWWGDERCVPPTDEQSNYRLARISLLDRLERLPEVHRMQGELPPEEAADDYERALTGTTLDLLFLGLGPDAHVASLFPDSPQLAERTRLVAHGPAGLEPCVHRVTLTMPALLSARRIVVLVTGASKADAVERAFFGQIGEDAPASLLRTGVAPIDVYVDPPAAGERR
jgi:6-phosphogluconolactonase